MKKLKDIDASCAVVALLHASGLPEDTVLRICRLHGFEPGEGMDDEDWIDAAEDLGLKIKKVSMRACKLSRFIKKFPEGLFLLGTYDHLFVVDNGLIVDPNEKAAGTYPGLGRIVKVAWRVK